MGKGHEELPVAGPERSWLLVVGEPLVDADRVKLGYQADMNVDQRSLAV